MELSVVYRTGKHRWCDIDKRIKAYLDQVTAGYAWFGINMEKYELEEIRLTDGFGTITWLHKENDPSLPYAQRRLQCTGMFVDERTGEVNQYNNPEW